MSGLALCGECGMPVESNEYHPYAACLMFKACGNSVVVRMNLDSIVNRATAAPVVVGEVTDAMVERACRAMVKAGGMYDPDMPVIDMDNKPAIYWQSFIRDAKAALEAALAGD